MWSTSLIIALLASPGLVAAVTTDTCANVSGSLKVTVSPGLPKVTVGQISQNCLCISNLDVFMASNVVAIAASAVAGSAATSAALITMIQSSASSRTCLYPDEAVAQCTASSVCAFTCINGFSQNNAGNTCICPPGNVVCNGVCQASSLCPSSQPTKRSRSPKCKFGWTACGVPSGAPWAYECIDTRSDLESCGGCVTPLTKYSPRGEDCSSLPGVQDVSCTRGSCVVLRCQRGYTVSADHSACIPNNSEVVNDYAMALQRNGKYGKDKQA